MSFIQIQPKGGFKKLKHVKLKNWYAECPKCSHKEMSEGDGSKCPNCNGEIQMTYGHIFSQQWESEEARKSWRMISCVKGDGWQVNQLTCSKCGAIIQGDYFKGEHKGCVTNCFVATSAFNGTNHPTVFELQQWRDDFLLTKKAGKKFVKFYYRYGPKLASLLDKAPILKPFVRTALTAVSKLLPRK